MGEPAPVGSGSWLALLRRPLVLKAESLAFLVLSVADLIVSRIYFGWENLWWGYEVNPLAAQVLRHYGLRGLAFYKFAVTAVVLVACQAVYDKYPRLTRALLIGACVGYTWVVSHAVWRLYAYTGFSPW